MAWIEVQDVAVQFGTRDRPLRAVDGVSLSLFKGESLGLVGESGCGKTTLAGALLGLAPLASGSILYEGRPLHALDGAGWRKFRREVQMIFQDPFGSLNPRLTVGAVLDEVLAVHGLARAGAERRTRIAGLLEAVGLDPRYANRYPHEFSGGQRQRIGIARALAVEPALIIADEPVSALDVSVQAQILNLLQDLRARLGLGYLLIAHDLAVVRAMCERVAVMYRGRVVEQGPAAEILERPSHPYTEALLSAVPDVEKGLQARRAGSARIVLRGDVPSAEIAIPGCPFHPRCHRAEPRCSTTAPALRPVSDGHCAACLLA